MGLLEVLGELWRGWTDSFPNVVLFVLLAVLLAGWAVSGVAVHMRASDRLTSTYGWTVSTVVPAVAVAAVGIAMARSFHLWVIAGLVATPLLALLNRTLIDKGASDCPQGHAMAASWVYCPGCPPPPKGGASSPRAPLAGATVAPGASRARSGGPVGMAGSPRSMANPTVGGYSPSRGIVDPDVPAADVLLWLVPDSRAELGEQVVRRPGGTLGRDPASDVAIEDPGASWEHARIIERDGSPAIVDLGSSNGTYVNNERVETSLLISGDRLKVGDTVFRVVRP